MAIDANYGNSYALGIEYQILEPLKITPDTSFEIMSDGQCLVLTPVRDYEEKQKFQKSLKAVHARFGLAVKKLAE